ncbi:hypothetical protein C8R42DRAFT_726257 [Lentinula raphanica]|nr:hypothetical protein C8R42DRAFT_726257 [Lentinula raphanica]
MGVLPVAVSNLEFEAKLAADRELFEDVLDWSKDLIKRRLFKEGFDLDVELIKVKSPQEGAYKTFYGHPRHLIFKTVSPQLSSYVRILLKMVDYPAWCDSNRYGLSTTEVQIPLDGYDLDVIREYPPHETHRSAADDTCSLSDSPLLPIRVPPPPFRLTVLPPTEPEFLGSPRLLPRPPFLELPPVQSEARIPGLHCHHFGEREDKSLRIELNNDDRDLFRRCDAYKPMPSMRESESSRPANGPSTPNSPPSATDNRSFSNHPSRHNSNHLAPPYSAHSSSTQPNEPRSHSSPPRGPPPPYSD